MSELGQLYQTYTKTGLCRYEIEVVHRQLHKHQLIRGADRDIVARKAYAKAAQWDQMWARKVEAEAKKRTAEKKSMERQAAAAYAEARKQEAEKLTSEAQVALSGLDEIIKHKPRPVDWNRLKDTTPFPTPRPTAPQSPHEPVRRKYQWQPTRNSLEYDPDLSFLDKLISSRRARKEQEQQQRFESDHRKWSAEKAEADAWYESQLKMHDEVIRKLVEQHKLELAQWERAGQDYTAHQAATNASIDQQRMDYESKEVGAIVDYCYLVLSSSPYPESFPQECEIEYGEENKQAVVDYQLPSIDEIPVVESYRYVKTRDEMVEKQLAVGKKNQLYDHVLYQIALRTVHELFEGDTVKAVESVVFNGFVRSLDAATGHETNACLISLQASKEEFEAINLQNVEAKACFKRLKGVGSSKLHKLTPIAPLVKIEKDDRRFVSSYDVADDLDHSENIAAMDWEDFEHLIREIFEKEFSHTGGEVKVTRASRDGGIDAVIFDPDPLRGGKIVVQAKRYTNTVGVAAVRELYGTLVNEGANKGILVTTSDYGPDAYQFIRDKPLTLLNGANLLHLLQKHGHEARIDLKEAKETLSAS